MLFAVVNYIVIFLMGCHEKSRMTDSSGRLRADILSPLCRLERVVCHNLLFGDNHFPLVNQLDLHLLL